MTKNKSEQFPLFTVTILTGFLGAGKTTLINQLLKQNREETILIIENEFGAVNIDSELLDVNTNIKLVEITKGCICCTFQGELTDVLHRIHSQYMADELQFDRIIIETTGLADPGPIIQTFFIDEFIRKVFQIDAIVTLVDAQFILEQLEQHRVVLSQIGFADLIILTKSDCINEKEKENILNRINKINKKAAIFDVINGIISKSQWLDIHAFDLSDQFIINQGFLTISSGNKSKTKFKQFLNPEISNKWHDDICSYYFEAEELDLKKIGTFMERLIDKYGNDMLRYKGVFAIKSQDKRLIVQGVHKVVGFDYGSSWKNNDKRSSRLLIISRTLPFDKLNQYFLNTVAS